MLLVVLFTVSFPAKRRPGLIVVLEVLAVVVVVATAVRVVVVVVVVTAEAAEAVVVVVVVGISHLSVLRLLLFAKNIITFVIKPDSSVYGPWCMHIMTVYG